MTTAEYRKLGRKIQKPFRVTAHGRSAVNISAGSVIKTKRTYSHPEQGVQKAIIQFWELKGAIVVKMNNAGILKPDGSYIPPRESGISDLIIGYKGLFIALEVKAPGGKPSEVQLEWLQKVKDCQCISVICWSLDDAISVHKTVETLLKRQGGLL